MNRKDTKDKKTKYIKVLVTEEQKNEIESTAKACGKSASSFLCERGLGYEPKHILTEKEYSFLESAQTAIKELTRFTNVISGKAKGIRDPKVRMQFLADMGIVKSWKAKLDEVLDFLYSLITNVGFRHVYNYDR